ncbi:IS5 family transposase [Streptomyces sp. NPDC048507]|uniref:IS5 family transposase n=1 Tax=Streptomyces sp. NPDC048507 TaxID=3365560 RepID=UPI0037218301
MCVLTDAQWARIEPVLPDRTPRRVAGGVAFKYRTGTPWTDLSQHFGSWKGAHNRLRKWAADGTWERVFTTLLTQADAEGDSTRRRGPSKGAPGGEPADHAPGRSRGGPTTKIHLAADSRCRPLAFVIPPGQTGDAPAFSQVMARPRVTLDTVLADKAYSSRAIRSHPRRRGIRAVIPQPADQPPTGSGAAATAAARPPSTARPTSSGTPSNAAPTRSSSDPANLADYAIQFHYALPDNACAVELTEAVPAAAETPSTERHLPGAAFSVAFVPDEDPDMEPTVHIHSHGEHVIPHEITRWFMEPS